MAHEETRVQPFRGQWWRERGKKRLVEVRALPVDGNILIKTVGGRRSSFVKRAEFERRFEFVARHRLCHETGEMELDYDDKECSCRTCLKIAAKVDQNPKQADTLWLGRYKAKRMIDHAFPRRRGS